MALEPGARLGPYEIVSPAGAGGMGEVYRARDTRLDRTVAIKVLPPDLTSDPAARQRFEREARAVAALSHPHICTLHDIGRQDGTDYLVMEYLDGETLAARLARGKLPVDQALQYGIQIADALAAAHKAGIVHRDLKPGNVMPVRPVRQGNAVALLDRRGGCCRVFDQNARCQRGRPQRGACPEYRAQSGKPLRLKGCFQRLA